MSIFSVSAGEAIGQDSEAFRERIFLAVPTKSKYAALREISLGEVRQEGFISLGAASSSQNTLPMRSICDRFCELAGFTPRVIFESDSPAVVRDLIGAGMGIGFWPSCSWGDLDNRNVVLLPVKEPDCRRDIVVRFHRKDSASPAQLEFYEYLIGSIRAAGGIPLA